MSVFRKNKVGQKAEPKTTNNNNRLKKKKGPGRPRKLPSTDEKTSAQTLADNQIQTNDYDQSSDGESVENKRKASQVSV